jgi:hypothetical protein
MARETKFARAVREEQEAATSYASFLEDYPERFANLMFKFMSTPGFSVRVASNNEQSVYEFVNASSGHYEESVLLLVRPSTIVNVAQQNAMDSAEYWLDAYEQQVKEQMRLESVRVQAKAKVDAVVNSLTAEERKLLGM